MSVTIPLPEKWPVGRPYSNSRRLWTKGHRINGRTAWRLQSREFARPYGNRIRHHSKYALGKRWVDFGDDWVWVKQENGEYRRYGRAWWLPFIVQVWTACDFSSARTIHTLKYSFGLIVAKDFGERIFMWHIKKRWEEVKEYAVKHDLFNIPDKLERHDKNTKFAEKVRDTDDPSVKIPERLKAADLVGRELGRIIAVAVDADRKASAEAEADKTKNLFLEKLDRIAETNADTDSP